MTNTDMPKQIHQGKNVKRLREMIGLKQEALAYALGDEWTQKKVSVLESKEVIEEDILAQVASILKVTPEVIKNFSEEAVINYFNTFNDSSGAGAFFSSNNFHCNFNPIEKIVQLYDEKIELYERMLREKNEMLEKLTSERKA